jgi:signal transduction histidine kinase
MTGYANLNSAKDAIKQGAIDYIMKPFELDEIRRAVTKAVKKLQQEAAARDTGQQIDQLSDLNELLLTVPDRPALCIVSTRFAMMNCQSNRGDVVFWNRDHTVFTHITIVGEKSVEEPLPADMMNAALQRVDLAAVATPQFISGVGEHPLLLNRPTSDLTAALRPHWYEDDLQLIMIPVRRSNQLLGIITIGVSEDTSFVRGADLKLMGLIASQLALSLENLELLEETQAAYARLKELQDETIELEKMASRGELSAEIGHELNNFLGVVTGSVSMLDHFVDRKQYDEIPKHLRSIRSTLEQVTAFTANLMDLTPISSQQRVIQFDHLLAEVIEHLKPQRRFQAVTLVLNACEQSILFDADSVHIQQLLYNLLNNAADATKGCECREVTIATTVNDADSTFEIQLRDSGVGMDQEQQAKLFHERFTTKENGHGYGMVVCRRIVENHAGTIHVTSAPNAGTTITISFPLTRDHTVSPQPTTSADTGKLPISL